MCVRSGIVASVGEDAHRGREDTRCGFEARIPQSAKKDGGLRISARLPETPQAHAYAEPPLAGIRSRMGQVGAMLVSNRLFVCCRDRSPCPLLPFRKPTLAPAMIALFRCPPSKASRSHLAMGEHWRYSNRKCFSSPSNPPSQSIIAAGSIFRTLCNGQLGGLDSV